MRNFSTILYLTLLLAVHSLRVKQPEQLSQEIKNKLHVKANIIAQHPIIDDLYIIPNKPLLDPIDIKMPVPEHLPRHIQRQKPVPEKKPIIVEEEVKMTPDLLIKEMKEMEAKYQVYLDEKPEIENYILVADIDNVEKISKEMLNLHEESKLLKYKIAEFIEDPAIKEPYQSLFAKYLEFRDLLTHSYNYYYQNKEQAISGINLMESEPYVFTRLDEEIKEISEMNLKIQDLTKTLEIMVGNTGLLEDSIAKGDILTITDYIKPMIDAQSKCKELKGELDVYTDNEDIAESYDKLKKIYTPFRDLFGKIYDYFYEAKGKYLGGANIMVKEPYIF